MLITLNEPLKRSKRTLIVCLALFIGGCSLADGLPRAPFPELNGKARFVESNVSLPLDDPNDPHMILALKKALERTCRTEPANPKQPHAPINILAISGGGSYGTFDVGVLNGWTESGTRPKFDMVTGISTGALIGTFAFIGPKYDEYLHSSYVNATMKDIYVRRSLFSLLRADSIASSEPLRKKIAEAITEEVLREVMQAHAEGRRFYVGTTNLDTRRFVIWDMGAIASKGTPQALELFRKVILASASVPGFFPPVLIDVEVDGQIYQELHVDGGSTASVFVPLAMMRCTPDDHECQKGSNVYVISSGKLFADSRTVKRQFVTVTYNAISAMLYSGLRNDVYRIFNQTLLCGMNFHLMAIPQDFPLDVAALSFEQSELHKLYDLGFRMGKSHERWRETPPGVEATELTLPRTGTQFRLEK